MTERAPRHPRTPGPAPAAGARQSAAGTRQSDTGVRQSTAGARPSDRAGAAPQPLVALQQRAGNRAVSTLLDLASDAPSVQRVPVTVPSREETLFNQRATPGQAGAAVYGGSGGAILDMARDGTPESVTVTVRIRFIQDTRALSAPDASGNTHPVDGGSPSVIPPGDARRAFAQNICDTAPAHWTGRAVLVGTRSAATFPESVVHSDPGGPVRLPLKFRAVPVWDLKPVAADKEIRVFPQTQQAGGPIHPIDAGHYYMNKGPNYSGATDEAIYAHEYGHLLGLSDEYSQSNPEMHALMHGMDPGTAAERGKAMDREAVRRMVLAALIRPLMDRVSASTAEIAKVFNAGRAPVTTGLAVALRTALNDPTVRARLVATMPPAQAALTPRVAPLVNAAVRDERNTGGVASSTVAAEFAAGPIGAMVQRLYYKALGSAVNGAVDVGGLDMKINVEGSAGIDANGNAVIPPTGLWAGGGGAPAADISAAVDHAAGAARTGRVPPMRASGSVLRELAALPAGWAGIPAGAPAALSGGTLTADLNSALLSAWVANLVSTAPAPTPIARRRALAAAVQSSVHAAAQAAAVNAVRAFLQAELEPVMHTSTTALMAGIGDEVTRIMGTPANQLALTSPRDPAIAAIATQMHTLLVTQNAAATATQIGAGKTPIDPGTTAPAQQVTYSSVNMMSSNDDIFRSDQFTALADVFNSKSGLKHRREGDFHVEMGAT